MISNHLVVIQKKELWGSAISEAGFWAVPQACLRYVWGKKICA